MRSLRRKAPAAFPTYVLNDLFVPAFAYGEDVNAKNRTYLEPLVNNWECFRL